MSENRMMESYKFKVGDRVRCVEEAVGFSNDVKGKLGTIKIMIGVDRVNYGVEFDDRILFGHRCYMHGEDHCAADRGWWCLGSSLEPADRSPLPDDIEISFEEMFKDESKRIGSEKEIPS